MYSDKSVRRGCGPMRQVDAEETRAHLLEMQSVCGSALGTVKEMPARLTEIADWGKHSKPE